MKTLRGVLSFCILAMGLGGRAAESGEIQNAESPWTSAEDRAAVYEDCGRNAGRVLQGWIDRKRDPETHLYSKGGTWNYHNEAADHYSSLVLIAHYVSPELIAEGGTLHRTLLNCRQLCATPDGLPAVYDLKRGVKGDRAQLKDLAEWLRDGLIRIVEVLGMDNDWGRELQRLTSAMLAEAEQRGGMAEAFPDTESAGNMLQTLARLCALTGDDEFLMAAESLADFHLSDAETTIRRARFGDHGCELIPGLGELYALEQQLGRPKAKDYEGPLREVLDGMLAVNRHPQTGLLCQSELDGGARTWSQPPDTWGYVLFTYENYDRGAAKPRYNEAIEKPLRWLLEHQPLYDSLRADLWPRSKTSDDWSDSYESMIVLWKRYPDAGDAFGWLDWATRQHIHRRQGEEEYGPYTGGHYDGSTGRTLCIHMMMCSQGVRTVPFEEGLGLGGVQQGETLRLSLESAKPWRGKLCFDPPRGAGPAAAVDWARINEMPQWFVAQPGQTYEVAISDQKRIVDGQTLIDGIDISVSAGQKHRIVLKPVRAQ